MFKVNTYTARRSNFVTFMFAVLLNGDKHFFFLRVDPFRKVVIAEGNKQEVTKIFPLCQCLQTRRGNKDNLRIFFFYFSVKKHMHLPLIKTDSPRQF